MFSGSETKVLVWYLVHLTKIKLCKKKIDFLNVKQVIFAEFIFHSHLAQEYNSIKLQSYFEIDLQNQKQTSLLYKT